MKVPFKEYNYEKLSSLMGRSNIDEVKNFVDNYLWNREP